MSYCDYFSASERDRVYHDSEWGIPLHDDNRLFEALMLECLQCGLSWGIILKKRDVIRECFSGFDVKKVAAYTRADEERIISTEGMIKNPGKIRAVIGNAGCFEEISRDSGGFDKYLFSFTGGRTIVYEGHDEGKIPVSNALSKQIAADLKKKGFKYLGPVTVYSFLQAVGVINDHDRSCPRGQMINRCFPVERRACRGEEF